MAKTKKWLLILTAIILVICFGWLLSLKTFDSFCANASDVADEQTLRADISNGEVKLANDITIHNPIEVNANATIDLNGHILKFVADGNTSSSSNQSVIVVSGGATLTVADSGTNTVHYYTVADNGLYVFSDGLTDGNAICGGVIYGGLGKKDSQGATYGGGVYVESGACLVLKGGNIAGNSAGVGAGVYGAGDVTLSGGTITGNVAENGAGGVYTTGALKIMGGAVVRDNYSGTAKKNYNIQLDSGKTVEVIGSIDDNAKLYFTIDSTYSGSFLTGYANGGSGDTAYDNSAKNPANFFHSDEGQVSGKIKIPVYDSTAGSVVWREASVVTGVSYSDRETTFTGQAQADSLLPSNSTDVAVASLHSGISDVQLRNAGTYNITLSLVSSDGALKVWDDGTVGDKNFTITIDPKTVAEPTQVTQKIAYTGSEINFEYTDSDDAVWYKVKEGSATKGTDIGEYVVTFELTEPNNTVWATAGTSSDFTITFEIEDLSQTSLFWLVLVLSAVLIVELLAFSIYWQERRRKENPDMYDQTDSNGGTMTDAAIPVTSASILAAFNAPTWEIVLVAILAVAIVGVALYNVIKIAMENAKPAHATTANDGYISHNETNSTDTTNPDTKGENKVYSTYGGTMQSGNIQPPPPPHKTYRMADEGEKTELTDDMMVNDDRPPEEIMADNGYHTKKSEAKDYPVNSPWFTEEELKKERERHARTETAEEPQQMLTPYAWDDNEKGLHEEEGTKDTAQPAIYTLFDEEDSSELKEIPKDAKPAEHIVITDENGEVDEVLEGVDEARNIAYVVRYKRSFTARLMQSWDESKEYYQVLKNEALSYKNTKSRVNWDYDCISVDMRPMIKLDIRGKTLCLYLALKPEYFAGSKFAVERTELKKCDDVPCLYRIKDDKCLSLAKELIAQVASNFGISRGRSKKENYYLPYENIQTLVGRKLAKEYLAKERYDAFLKKSQKTEDNKKAETKKSTAKSEVAPKVKAQSIIEDERNYLNEDDIEEERRLDANGKNIIVQYNKSFTAKLIQSSDETKSFYADLKNEIMSYKKTKSTVWWSCDSIRTGNRTIARFGICNQTLCLYIALNPASFNDGKYQVETAEGKRYEHVPCLYRIKNAKREKYAKDLIAELCKKYGLEWDGNRNDNYYLPYESTDALLAKDLIKEVGTKKDDEDGVDINCAAEVEKYRRDVLSAGEADRLISDYVATACIIDETGGKPFKGNLEEINIDKICANYGSEDTVNLENLKAKGLVSEKAKGVKVIARGTLSKPLIVEAQDFSTEAVKMIVLTGGSVRKVR